MLALILAITLVAETSSAPVTAPPSAGADTITRFRTLDVGALGKDVAPAPSQASKPSLSVSPYT